MNLNALKWRQAVIEVRYPTTYRAFDHAGELVDQIIDGMPNWEVKRAVPDALELIRPAYGLSSFIGLNAMRVTQMQTDEYYDLEDLKYFHADAPGILGPVLNTYRVTEFSRIGYRTMMNYACGTQEDAMRAWQQLPFFSVKLPEAAPAENKPGAVVLNLSFGDDLDLRFEVSNLAVEVSVAGRQIDWTQKKIHKLPSAKRKSEFDALLTAERKFKFLPQFGLEVDLDWSREDWMNAKPEDIDRFVRDCSELRAKVLPMILGATQ